MNIQFFFALITATTFVVCLEAKCCKRKDNRLCCGNGKCDISCCNCDGGCNTQCQLAKCSPLEWIECSGALALCATACIVPADPECEECLGFLYELCRRCLMSPVDIKKVQNDTRYMLNAYCKDMYRYNINYEEILQA